MKLKKEIRKIVKYMLDSDASSDLIENYVDTFVLINKKYIKQLTLTDVVVAERTLICKHEWINNTHKKTKYCRKGCDGFDEIGI